MSKSSTITLIIDETVVYRESQPETIVDGTQDRVRENKANMQTALINDEIAVFQNTKGISGEIQNVFFKDSLYLYNGFIDIDAEHIHVVPTVTDWDIWSLYSELDKYIGICYKNPTVDTYMVATCKTTKQVVL